MTVTPVTLMIHLEPTGDEVAAFVWWAESEDLPGFSAAADHLPELIQRATAAIEEILGPDATIIQKMVFDDEAVTEARVASPSDTPTAPAVETRQKISSPLLQSA